jgi:hypothetical protein
MDKYKIKKIELDEISHVEKIAEREFFGYIQKENLKPKPKESLCKMKGVKDLSEVEEIVDEKKQGYIDKMYKILSRKLHPDKTNGETQTVYKEITEHYKNKKMEELFKIMEEYGYDDIMRDEEVYEILVLSCDKTIEEIKGKIHYKWYIGTDADRKQIISSMFIKL